MAQIVVMGGGTGMNIVLRGLKAYNHDLSAIISMVSNGGSTGRLRDELGVSPVGNVRQCILALSNVDEFMTRLLDYRFEAGEFRGHNFGNICLAAMEKVSGNIQDTIKYASKYMKVQGSIIPAALQDTDLCAELDNGQLIYGETEIDQPKYNKDLNIINIFLEPTVTLNPQAKDKIEHADFIIIGPGDFYNILSYFLVNGMIETMRESKAKIIYVCNIINRHGVTNNFKLIDYIKHIEKYLGKGVVDYYLYNTKKLDGKMETLCEQREESFVEHDDKDITNNEYKVVTGELLSDEVFFTSHVDCIQRSFIRHDRDKLATLLNQIISGEHG